jgi:hypothetical protein
VVSLGRYPGRYRATRCMLVMELTRGDDDADFVIEGHEAEAAARVETVDEAHEGLLGAVEALAVHGPAAMTMNVYAQLQQRAERSHGEPGDVSGRVRKSFGLCEGADWGAAKSVVA